MGKMLEAAGSGDTQEPIGMAHVRQVLLEIDRFDFKKKSKPKVSRRV